VYFDRLGSKNIFGSVTTELKKPYICAEMEIKLSQKQKELIEKSGVSMEKSGLAPAQARILSLLMICDRTELTFDEIYQTLQISKSAASNAINSLLMMERLQYHTKPGDRKRYFTNPIGSQEGHFEKSMVKMLEINKLLKEILENRTKTTKEFNAKLQRFINFMEFLQKELPEVYKKWRKQQQ
jgi:DNA-binding transcriptional regulator GbsR (MarR family)